MAVANRRRVWKRASSSAGIGESPARILPDQTWSTHQPGPPCSGTVESPEWRKGPDGPKSLCNACGTRLLLDRHLPP